MEKTAPTVDYHKLHAAVPTNNYTDLELANIYNQARVDYIVPMPMNGNRMRQYIDSYDIDLEVSAVALDIEELKPNGIIMLGIRDERTWITRLGVIPVRRRRKSGLFLMDVMIEESRKRGKKFVQLEVIKGNEPAHRLFSKLGFEITRELLIIRRPPGPIADDQLPKMTITPIDDGKIFDYIEKREAGASWVEETSSLRNAGNMNGLIVNLPSGEKGWVAYQRSPFQLAHFVLDPTASPELTSALIAAVHSQNPLQDTKIENLPAKHSSWPIFQKWGYFEAFARIEMLLQL